MYVHVHIHVRAYLKLHVYMYVHISNLVHAHVQVYGPIEEMTACNWPPRNKFELCPQGQLFV